VRVWDVKDKIQICEFGGHKFSIECVCFTNNNLIVSIGSIHDMVVNVWNLKSKFKVASNKIACKIKGIAFSRDSSFFVTVGNRHVKYWYLTVSSLMETVPLKGRAAILSDMRNMNFCDVVCGTGDCIYSTYTITTNGILCEFNNEQRCINRSIDLPSTEHAYCIYADNRENLFIGCSNGTILIFRQKTLEIITCLPRPHSLGIDLSIITTTTSNLSSSNNNKYPDCIALCFDNNEFILSSIYNDHSFYVWDIKDLNKVKKLDSHLFHSSCCWSLDTYSSVFNNNNNNNNSISSSSSNLPIDTFITCSSDNTVRIWSNTANNNYSKELLKIIYIDNDLSALCEIGDSLNSDSSSSNTTEQCPTTTNTTTTTTSCPTTTTTTNTINNESKMGARCLKISPYGKHLATGDRNGNIRITDLQTLESIALIEAHDGEVLYLQYSQPEYTSRLLLASSSRDRLIHIFDASRSTYDLLQTLDDHSAAITAVRFCFNQYEKQLYIISCGADKSIMFRTLIEQQQQQQQQSSLSSLSSITSSGIGGGCSSTSSSSSSSPNFNNTTNSNNNSSSSSFQFVRTSYVAEKQTFYDLNSDPSRNFIYTISQDRIIRTYSIKDGKKLRQFRGSLNEDGYLIKMDIDKTGQLLATSCTDKCVYIWDINTTECIAYLCGHSEVVYDLKFTHDNKHLITVSADGCIFMWRLNNLLNNNNNNELALTTRKLSSSSSCSNTNTITSTSTTLIQNQLSLDDIFSDSDNEQLPAWARNKLSTISTSTSVDNEQQQQQQPKRVRAVWGPVSDTSFSFMVDTENQSIINQSSLNSFLVDNNDDDDDDEDSNEQEVEIVEEEEEEEEESIQTTIIQNNEDDNEQDNDENDLISFPKPINDTKLDTSSTSTSSSSSSSSSTSTTSNNNNNSTTKTTIATVRKSWVCSNKEQDLLFSLLNSTNESNKELSNFESLALEEQSPSTSLSTSQNNNNSSIKLDCDLENSFRRQSLSARYLMRAQQNTPTTTTTTTPTSSLLNKSYDDMKPPISPNFSSPTSSTSSSSTSTASSTHSSPSLKKIQSPITTTTTTTSTPIDIDESLKECENNTNLELIIKSDKQQPQQKEQININQMTADLVKMRKKAAQLTTNNNNNNNNNINKIHSHHTESSLNKTKPKQQQQQQLKRSPSVNSINNDNNNNKNGLLGDSSASSSSSSIKNVKTKMISKQISVISTTNTNNNHTSDDTNLKKAASMVSLIATTTNKQHILNNNNTKQLLTKNSHQQLSTQNNQLLPPKTVRQVKQRSAERQLTILPLSATTTSNSCSKCI